MMMTDLFLEILATMRRNKLRTTLTGFAVAWGIFILIVFLGAGNGLLNAQNEQTASAMNSVMVGAGWTTQPHDGLKQGRRIQLNNGDLDITRQLNRYVEEAGARLMQRDMNVSFGSEYLKADLVGVHPNYREIERPELTEGRFINALDVREMRKVAVMNERSAEVLFRHRLCPIGQMVNVGGVMFKVVGIYRDKGDQSGQDVFVPFTTMQTIYNKGDKLHNILFTIKNLDTEEANEAFEADYRAAIGTHQRFAKDDAGAIWIWNRFTQMMQMNQGNRYLRTAIWVIGLFTLLSGVVGVSNIMLITVKERTREFGIRKALGAKPLSILKVVMVESVVITAVFGYIGLLAGIGATEYMNMVAGRQEVDTGLWQTTTFLDPTVDIGVAVNATLTLIIAGTLAGLFPALKAVRTRPIEALRAE